MTQGNDGSQQEAIDAWVRRYRGNVDEQCVSGPYVERAVGVLELVAEQARECGFEVPHPDDEGFVERFGADARWAHIAVGADDAAYFFRVQEICAPNPGRKAPTPPGGPADGEGEGEGEPRWIAERSREFISTGRLQMQIRSEGDRDCRKTARDSTASMVEGKIPGVFRAFVAAQERRRLERERRVEWERIRRRGEERYESEVIMRRLDDMAAQYLAMRRRREFLDALEGAVEGFDGPLREQALCGIGLLRERVDREDPGLHPELVDLEVPPPGNRELERFMEGWSADGPYRVSPQPMPPAFRADPWPERGEGYGRYIADDGF